jgi:hypothetical protein
MSGGGSDQATAGTLTRGSSALRSDGIVIARSRRASRDARLSMGYGDAAIQGSRGALRSPGLLRFARNDDDLGSTQMQFALDRHAQSTTGF